MNKQIVEYVEMVRNLIAPPNLHGLTEFLNINTPDSFATDHELQMHDALTADLNLIHMALGLSGEALELVLHTDQENLKEELGDLMFYVTGTMILISERLKSAIHLHVDTPYMIEEAIGFGTTEPITSLIKCIEKATDLCKKVVFYRQETIKNSSQLVIDAIWGNLREILYRMEGQIPLVDLMNHNSQKLAKGANARYKGGKFTEQEAAERRDK